MITVNLTSQLLANLTSPKYAANFPLGNRVSMTAWKLAADYKVGQKLPLAVVYPRPDGETPSNAIHRKASANWQYEMRICIQGGEAPFKHEIISGPAGATLVRDFDRAVDGVTGLTVHTVPAAYATVKWSNPTGTAIWVVRVTDQSDAYVDVTWTTVTDEPAFIYLDSVSGSDSNAGTFASPKQTFATGIWKDSDVDSTYATKIVAFKTGTYPIHGASAISDCSITNGVKPRSFIGIQPNVVLNTSTGHFYGNTGDIAFVNMELSGSRSDLADNRIIQIPAKGNNYLFWKLTFSNQTVGTTGFDNPACIMFWDDTTYTNYVAVVDCIATSTSKMQLIVTFTTNYIIVENNGMLNINYFPISNGSRGIHMKDDTKNATVRFNILTGYSQAMIAMSNQQSFASGALNQEVCYNYVASTQDDAELGTIPWNQSATSYVNAANTHCYKNTIKSGSWALSCPSWLGGDNVQLAGTAYVAPYGLVYYSGYTTVSPINVSLVSSDLDSNGKLTNTSGKRATYLGKLGFEIASTLN